VELSCENDTSLYLKFLETYKTFINKDDLIDFESSGYNQNSILIQVKDNYLKQRPDVSLCFIPLNEKYQDAKYVTPTSDEKKFCGEDEGDDGDEGGDEGDRCCIQKFMDEKKTILTDAEKINDDIYNLFKINVSNGEKYDGTNFRVFVLITIPYVDTYYYQYIEPNTISFKN
jgi:hypothetical protein